MTRGGNGSAGLEMGKGVALVIGLLVAWSGSLVFIEPAGETEARAVGNGTTYVAHAPIRINSDADFDAAHGVSAGNGTASRPWIIENWEINGTAYGYCMYIGNTTDHFVLRDCYMRDASGGSGWPYYDNQGVMLYSVQNGAIINSNASSNDYDGICLYNSTNNSCIGNTAIYNHWGIYTLNCYNNTITNNMASYNLGSGDATGIYLQGSHNNIINDNNASLNEAFGICLTSSNNNAIANNTASWNVGAAISLSASINNTLTNNNASMNGEAFYIALSCNNTITGNIAYSNLYCGFDLWSSCNNSIHHNNILSNTNQAYDNTNTNQWDNSYPSGGNYWSDYLGSDTSSGPGQNLTGSDGIGDAQYLNINGFGGAIDNYPLMAPWPPASPTIMTHAPIRIDSNSDFDAAHGVSAGNGTASSPWIIENWDINGTGYGYCIYVGNTTDHFTLRECNLHEASGFDDYPYYPDCGLMLYNVINATVTDITSSLNNEDGICLYYSDNNVIENNDITSSSCGIFTFVAVNNTISNNNMSANYWGIYLYRSQRNTIAWNLCSLSPAYHGIMLHTSNSNILQGNTCYNNALNGIYVYQSHLNTIESNDCHGNSYHGISLSSSQDNMVCNNTNQRNFYQGIGLWLSPENTIRGNICTWNGNNGIYLSDSHQNMVAGNNCSNNINYHGISMVSSTFNIFENNICNNNYYEGFYVWSSDANTFANNTVSYNGQYGFGLVTSSGNVIYHNNIVANFLQAYDDCLNSWDDGYPSGGNYWSDYTGSDIYTGPSQNIPGTDGIGDIPYTNIYGGAGVQDNYPLMTLWTSQPAVPQTSFLIRVVLGWNLISVPLEITSLTLPAQLLDGDTHWDRIMWYDPADNQDHWKQFNTAWQSSLNDLNRVETSMGFWIYITDLGDGYLNLSGTVPNSTQIQLRAGWNLVGYPTLATNMTAASAFWGTGVDMVETFDAVSSYRTKTVGPSYLMRPGEGYWVHVPVDTVWTINW